MITKTFIWLGKTFATVVLTVVVTLWLSGLILTSVVQSILTEYEIPITVKPAIYSGVLGYLWGYEGGNQSEVAEQGDDEWDVLTSQDGRQLETKEKDNSNTSSQQLGETELQEETGIELEQPSIEALAPIELEEQVEISNNELEQAKDSLTDAEKERLLQLVTEKIPAEQWKTISLYLEDGLSESELLETQQILAQHLTDDEYNELMGILKKS